MSLKRDCDLSPVNRDRIAQAKVAAQSKNISYAISLYEIVLKEEPLYRPAENDFLYTIAMAYVKMGKYQMACNIYDRILSVDPRDGDALAGLKNVEAAIPRRSFPWKE